MLSEFDKEEINCEGLWPFKLHYFGQLSCTIGYGVCVIISFHSSQLILSKLNTHVGGSLQIYMWLFDIDEID